MSKFISPFVSHERKRTSQGPFDTEYINYNIKDVVKKTGEGEDDFVIVQKVIEVRTPIKEVIDKDAGTTGIKAIMERALLTGDDSLTAGLAIAKDGVTSDYTNCPEDLMDAEHMASKAVAAFDALPDDLKKGRSFSEFCNSVTNEELAIWMASLAAQNNKKTEDDKKTEDKKEGDK